MTATRGPQVVLEGYARDVARGGGGRTMRDNIAAMDSLVSAGLVADGSTVDGSSRTGGRAYDPVVAQFPHAPVPAWEVPAPLLNVNASGGTGTITGPLGFWGVSSTISNYDAKIWATGGATVPGNDGQGELNYMAGRHVFQGYDGTTQFRIANIPWSWQWWEASGGSSGSAALLRAGSDLNADCSGVLAMQGHGNLTVGNGEGTIAQFMNIGQQIINYVRITPGGYNQGVSISAAGGDGLPSSFAVTANYNGGVNLSNSNGPLLVAADGQASGVPVASYFHFTTPNGAGSAVISLTAGAQSNSPLSVCSLGTGVLALCTNSGTTQARILHTASAVGTVDILGAVSGGSPQVRPSAGNLMLGSAGGIVPTSTAGMLQIPYTSGTPTGAPANATAGATMVYDTSANRLWIYSGSTWRSAVFT